MQISISTDGFICDLGNNASLTVRWEETKAIFFHCVELPNGEPAGCFLVFDYENGEFLEVSTGTDGFPNLLMEVEKRFPRPEGWQDAIPSNGSSGSIDLWQRSRK